jgi:putative transposase
VAALEKYGIVASMSRPANPYDNASCESFMKTLKQDEEYYNRQRLDSALGYRPPEEFEQQSERGHSTGSLGATLQFIVNDGNHENEERASKGLSGEGDSNAIPFPRPRPLLGDAKTLK